MFIFLKKLLKNNLKYDIDCSSGHRAEAEHRQLPGKAWQGHRSRPPPEGHPQVCRHRQGHQRENESSSGDKTFFLSTISFKNKFGRINKICQSDQNQN